MFNTEDLAYSIGTEPPAMRHWLRKAEELGFDIGTQSRTRPVFDHYDVALIALVRAFVDAKVPVESALGFAQTAIVDLGGADPDLPPEHLYEAWRGHEFSVINREGS